MTVAASRSPLGTLNPLAMFAAVVPPTVLLVFTRDAVTPLVFLVLCVALLLVAGRPSPRMILVLLVVLPLAVLLLGAGFAVWVDPAVAADSDVVLRIGAWSLHAEALTIGLTTGIRLGAIAALALLAGVTTTGQDLVRAMVQHLRVPYRVGYTALAAFRFVPRFGHELDLIRQAHRVRGAHGGRGPFAAVARWGGYMVPLLAGAIRHAERVALAMDARAFGAYPDRTERHLVPFRARDAVFVVALWVVSAALFVVFFPWGLS